MLRFLIGCPRTCKSTLATSADFPVGLRPPRGLTPFRLGYPVGMTLVLTILAMILLGLAAFRIITPHVHFGWLGLTVLVIAIWVLPAVHG